MQGTREWEHYLLDDDIWQGTLKQHFESIFNKQEQDIAEVHIKQKQHQLAALCRKSRWAPFTMEELRITQVRWPRRKAAGPDGIVHEALYVMMQDGKWAHRILYILNDALYRGVTPVHLPKTSTPGA